MHNLASTEYYSLNDGCVDSSPRVVLLAKQELVTEYTVHWFTERTTETFHLHDIFLHTVSRIYKDYKVP